MAIINAPSYECKLWKRGVNASDPKAIPIIFYAQMLGNREKNYFQQQGFITPSVRIMLRTDSEEIYESRDGEEVLGQVEFQGDLYLLQSITYDNSNAFGLGAGKFNKEHNQRNAVKVLALV